MAIMSVEKMPIDPKDGDLDSPSPGYASSRLVVDPAAEAKLLRKLDCWLAPMMIIAFLVAYLDRSNIGKFSVHHDSKFQADKSQLRQRSHRWHDRRPQPDWKQTQRRSNSLLW